MKAKKYFFILFFVTSYCSFAQLSGGIRAGGSFTNFLASSDQKNYKFIPGFHGGLYMEYDFTENLSFQTEVVYAKKGCNFKSFSSTTIPISQSTITITTEYKVKYDLAYIDVPFLLNINFGEMGSYIGLGPQVSFLVKNKSDGEITTNNPLISPSSYVVTYPNNEDVFSKVDVGFVIGTGSKFLSGIEYCLRAGYGFISAGTLFKDKGHSSSSSTSTAIPKYNNLVFTVTLGYAIGETSGSYVSGGHYSKKRRRH